MTSQQDGLKCIDNLAINSPALTNDTSCSPGQKCLWERYSLVTSIGDNCKAGGSELEDLGLLRPSIITHFVGQNGQHDIPKENFYAGMFQLGHVLAVVLQQHQIHLPQYAFQFVSLQATTSEEFD